MLQTNPKYVLKNHMLEKGNTLAMKGDFPKVESLLHIAQNSFDELPEYEHLSEEIPEKTQPLCTEST